MAITLNHTILPAVHNESAARFFAQVMGLAYEGPEGHFAPVRANDELTLDYLTVDDPHGHHVDPATFDGTLARLRTMGVPYGSEPGEPPPAFGRGPHTAGSTTHCARAACTSPTPPTTSTSSRPRSDPGPRLNDPPIGL